MKAAQTAAGCMRVAHIIDILYIFRASLKGVPVRKLRGVYRSSGLCSKSTLWKNIIENFITSDEFECYLY